MLHTLIKYTNMLIGIAGRIGHGKDEVARIWQYLDWLRNKGKLEELVDNNIISDKDDYSYAEFCKILSNWKLSSLPSYISVIDKVAETVKVIACLILNCKREDLESQEFKSSYLSEYNMTVREFLQKLGTDAVRHNLHEDVWINTVMSRYEKHKKLHQGYELTPMIISDVRFPNEANAVRSRNGVLIRVCRYEYKLIEHKDSNGDHTVSHSWKENGDDGVCGYYNDECYDKDASFKSFHEHYLSCTKGYIHESERALDDYKFDYTIDNSGSIDELVLKVLEIYKQVNKT